MWVIIIIAAIVVIYPKLGFKLNDRIEKLLYVDDDADKAKEKSTEGSKEEITSDTADEPKLDITKEPENKPKKVSLGNYINPIEKAGIQETEESKKSASSFMKNVYKGGMS